MSDTPNAAESANPPAAPPKGGAKADPSKTAKPGQSNSKKAAKPDRFEAARLQKLEKIEALGVDPWGQRVDGLISIAEATARCPEQAPEEGDPAGEPVSIAGRIMLRRKAGKLRFYDLADATGKIQLLFSRGDLPEETWELMGQLDLGDLIAVIGTPSRTNTGEPSLLVTKLPMVSKSLAQPPEKWHGLEDAETRLRQRYADLIYSERVRDKLLLRSQIVASVRQTLAKMSFVEVETPVLHSVATGAAARPFETHHNALDIPLVLRIALELHLKRLLVGGIERVYEIGRVFRNEGIDATHNPEFTMLEAYQAYGDYESMMDLTEAVFRDAHGVVRAAQGRPDGETTIEFDGHTIDMGTFARKTYAELFERHVGCAMDDADACRAEAAKRGIETDGVHPDVIVGELFEAEVEDNLGFDQPVFVIDYPASLCPLTKRKRGNPALAERFELFVAGMELANAYTELNDPKLQEELFRTQLDGQDDEDSMAKMDDDFIRALKVGMPPAGGLGIGIDRLVMLLTGSRSIRDVIFFPLLRPEG